MNTYRLTFEKNEIISCDLMINVIIAEDYYYNHDKGTLTHATVRAANEAEALLLGQKIIADFRQKTFGEDFISS